MVAFVGSGAERFIPRPKGLTLVCWNKPGCTDADTIRHLIELGVEVFFSDDLHMKVYWSATRGAVLGSANLSSNGLGEGGLVELAVKVPSDMVPAERILARLAKVKATPSRLDDLEHRTIAYRSANAGETVFGGPATAAPPPSFTDWYNAPTRKTWRLFAYDDSTLRLGEQGKEKLKERGYEKAEDYWTGDDGQTDPYRWLLSVNVKSKAGAVAWSCGDFRFRMKSDDPEYTRDWPYFAIQLRPTVKYGKPPFALDAATKKAIRQVLDAEGVKDDASAQRYAPHGKYPNQFVKLVAAALGLRVRA